MTITLDNDELTKLVTNHLSSLGLAGSVKFKATKNGEAEAIISTSILTKEKPIVSETVSVVEEKEVDLIEKFKRKDPEEQTVPPGVK